MNDRDAYAELTVSDDAMKAHLSLYPAIGEGAILTMDYVHALLQGAEVLIGVDFETIGEALFKVNTERRAVENLLVARGETPVPARPEYYRIITAAPTPVVEVAGRVDYRSSSRINIVQPGQTIARLVSAQEGVDGRTVRGDEIPAPTESVRQLRPGKNTRAVREFVVATVGGSLKTKDGEFFVEDCLEVAGAVGYETGSIEFPGDVVLRGGVKEGFHIWAGGSVTAKVTVDVSEIYCRKDFLAQAGLIGRKKRLLRAGGRVQAKFVGNCVIESKSSVFVQDYVYHSCVNALDRLAMGERGKIIGGSVTVGAGIRCYQLGNTAHIRTVVRAGIDFVSERRLTILRDKREKLASHVARLRASLTGEPTDRQLDILSRLEDAMLQVSTQMAELAETLDRTEDAAIVVEGPVRQGGLIQNCRATIDVDKQLNGVTFRLDKTTGRIVTESNKKSS